MNDTTDRFVIEIGTGTAAHIIDMTANESDEGGRWSLGPELPGEKMCTRGHRHHRFERVQLSAFAALQDIETTDFEGDAPAEICSYCWSNTLTAISQGQEKAADGVTERIGTVGYRLRWKQQGRARDEWYDIIVRPETTVAELDRLVCRFTTLDDFHLRMYGLEDEYMDSSLNVLPDRQYEEAGDRSYTRASELTIAEVAERATLWEGDRLSMVYDFGTPSHYYCIVKDVYDSDDIENLLDEREPITATETAAIIDEKRS